MAKFALVRGGKVVGFKELDDADDLAHKKDKRGDGGAFVRPVIDPGVPDHDPALETVETSTVVDKDAVRIVYKKAERSMDEVRAAMDERISLQIGSLHKRAIALRPGRYFENIFLMREADQKIEGGSGPFPLLQVWVDVGMAADLDDAAAKVMAHLADFMTDMAEIMKKRLSLQSKFEKAKSPADAVAAFRAADWIKGNA